MQREIGHRHTEAEAVGDSREPACEQGGRRGEPAPEEQGGPGRAPAPSDRARPADSSVFIAGLRD